MARGERLDPIRFYLKRAFRILPAYWVVVALYFTVPAFADENGLSPLWKFLTFTQNLGLDRSRFPAFSQAWSLCVEEHFYLLLPPATLLMARFASFRKTVIL